MMFFSCFHSNHSFREKRSSGSATLLPSRLFLLVTACAIITFHTAYYMRLAVKIVSWSDDDVSRNLAVKIVSVLDEDASRKLTWTPPAGPRTIAIYVGGKDIEDEMQRQKIKELQSYFGKDLMVAAENYFAIDWWVLPPKQVISPDSNIALTKKKAFSHRCCGQERSMMWLVQNQHLYDYAWVIEDDVLWSDFTDLTNFFQSFSNVDTDLLHSNPAMENEILQSDTTWMWTKTLLPPFVDTQAQFSPPFRGGLFQFYRISSRFVAALDDWRVNKNNGEWTFFEPMFANIAFRNDTTPARLTTKSFNKNPIGYKINIKFRPCYSLDDVYNKTAPWSNGGRGGLFHPVKKDAHSEYCTMPMALKKRLVKREAAKNA